MTRRLPMVHAKRLAMSFIPLAIALVGSACSAPDTPAASDGPLGRQDQEIQKGTPVSNPAMQNAVLVSMGGFICTGTIIAPHWVLTASHCVSDTTGGKDPKHIHVSMNGESHQATHLIVHPKSANFTGDDDNNTDAALIRFDEPFQQTLGRGTAPTIFTGGTNALIGDNVSAFGYGAHNFHEACSEQHRSCAVKDDVCDTGWNLCLTPSSVLRTGSFEIISDPKNDQTYIQLAVPNAAGQMPLPGDSGGAIWSSGEIVGVCKAGGTNPKYARYTSAAAFGTWASDHRYCPPWDPDKPSTTQCSVCRCDVGQGDCDSNAECRDGLVCVKNAGPKYGLPADYDMCEAPATCPKSFTTDRCKDPSCPCTYGMGDCDSDYECGGSMVCRNHIGAAVGAPDNYDICGFPTEPGCNAYSTATPSASFCNTTCKCDIGEGNCTSNDECRSGLICKKNVGAKFNLPSTYGVCVKP